MGSIYVLFLPSSTREIFKRRFDHFRLHLSVELGDGILIRLYSKLQEIRCNTAVPYKAPIPRLKKALFLLYEAEKSTFF